MTTQTTPQPSPNSEPATETTQAGPGQGSSAAPAALPAPVAPDLPIFTEDEADALVDKWHRAELLRINAEEAERERAEYAIECADMFLLGWASKAMIAAQRSRDAKERAARLRDEAEAVQW